MTPLRSKQMSIHFLFAGDMIRMVVVKLYLVARHRRLVAV
jgi:hypothetical protein